MLFTMKSDITFEADDLFDAFDKLKNHFWSLGQEDSSSLIMQGSIEIKEALLPCPFCGGSASIGNHEGPHTSDMNNPDVYTVRCNTCCSNVGDYETEKAAIKTWNRRTK